MNQREAARVLWTIEGTPHVGVDLKVWHGLFEQLRDYIDNSKGVEDMQNDIGNPLFAIETNVEVLRKYCPEEQAIFNDIQINIEKIKTQIKASETEDER